MARTLIMKVGGSNIFHYILKFNHTFCVLDFGIINHPVHIITNDNLTSPSSFIPFCEFGGDMSTVGVKVEQFNVPVCNSFQAKILNDQLCYEIDLNTFSRKANNKNEVKLGLNFILDYNEDRQIATSSNQRREEVGMARNIIDSPDDDAFISLDTIGKVKC